MLGFDCWPNNFRRLHAVRADEPAFLLPGQWRPELIGHDGKNRVSSRSVDERNDSELFVVVHAFRCRRGGDRGRRPKSVGYRDRARANASCNDGCRSLAEQLAATHFSRRRSLLVELPHQCWGTSSAVAGTGLPSEGLLKYLRTGFFPFDHTQA